MKKQNSQEKDSAVVQAGSYYGCSTDTRERLQPMKVENMFSLLSSYNLNILNQLKNHNFSQLKV